MSAGVSLLGEATYALIGGSARSIGGILPHVAIRELHRDGLVLTQHPVESGATITDHAFQRPCEVEMQVGFSNATAQDPGYARAVYQEFLAWRDSRDPRDVFTGKRAYQNMLPTDIGVETDARSEEILLVSVRLQQLTIVATQTTGTGSDTTSPNADATKQANPGTTAGVTDKGQVEAQSTSGYFPGSDGDAGYTAPTPAANGLSPAPSNAGGYFPGSEGDAGYDPYAPAEPSNPAGDYSGYSAPEPAQQAPSTPSTSSPSGTTTNGGSTVPSYAPYYNPFTS